MNCFTVADNANRLLIGAILDLYKTEQTRKRNTLRQLVGQRVGMVENVNGRKRLVAMVTIGDPIRYNDDNPFLNGLDRHRIGKDSRWFKLSGVGYPLINVKPVEPVEITQEVITVRHGYSWFECAL